MLNARIVGRARGPVCRLLGFTTALASACGPAGSPGLDSAAPDSGAPEAPAAPRPSHGLQLVQGEDFVVEVPADAQVERQRDSLGAVRWRVRAPTQLITASIGTADTTRFTDERPLYDLTISTGRKPATQALKAWGDSIVAVHEAEAGDVSRGETGALRFVAGDSVYLRMPTCGDCGVFIFTFARGDRLVELEYTTDTSEPLSARKHGIYALILSTFRWITPPTPR